MTSRAELFMGIIAVAMLATSIVQIGVLVAAGLLMRRIQRLVVQVEADVKPLFEHMNAIARDASRAASLATAQVERVDRMAADLAGRLDRTLAVLQNFVTGPVRNGATLVGGASAILAFIRDLRRGRGGRRATGSEEEDPLFI